MQPRGKYFAMIRRAPFIGHVKDIEIAIALIDGRKLTKRTHRWSIPSRKCAHHLSSSAFNTKIVLCAFAWKFATWSFFRFLARHIAVFPRLAKRDFCKTAADDRVSLSLSLSLSLCLSLPFFLSWSRSLSSWYPLVPQREKNTLSL